MAGSNFVIKNLFSREDKLGGIRQSRRRDKRGVVKSLMMVVGVMLLVSVGLGMAKSKLEEKRSGEKERIREIKYELARAEELVEVDRGRAREILNRIKNQESTPEDGQARIKNQGEKEEIMKEWEKIWRETSGRVVGIAELVFDLRVLRQAEDEWLGDRIEVEKEIILVWDKSEGMIVEIKADGGRGKIRAEREEFKKGLDFSSGYILGREGIWNEEGKLVKERDEDFWQEVIRLEFYAGNLYVLEKERGEIYRYAIREEDLGRRIRWLKKGEEPIFNRAVDMAIDGDIWVFEEKGIRRFRGGREENWEREELDEPFDKLGAGAVGEEIVVVLDSGRERVVVWDKETGRLVKQMIWSELREAQDIAILEEKILVLVKGEVYELR